MVQYYLQIVQKFIFFDKIIFKNRCELLQIIQRYAMILIK